MSEQELWEAIFTAALQGSASPYEGWDPATRVEFLINRATLIADAAVKRCEQRRRVIPPPAPPRRAT